MPGNCYADITHVGLILQFNKIGIRITAPAWAARNSRKLHCFSPAKVLYSDTGCARSPASFRPFQGVLMQVYRRSFEGQLEQLAAIHDFIDQAAAQMDLSEEDAFACRLAVEEAAANAFEHA